MGIQYGLRIKTLAMVFGLDLEPRLARGTANRYLVHTCVPGNIGQRFLHNVVSRCFDIGRQAAIETIVIEPNMHMSLFRISIEVPQERR